MFIVYIRIDGTMLYMHILYGNMVYTNIIIQYKNNDNSCTDDFIKGEGFSSVVIKKMYPRTLLHPSYI